VENPAAMWMFYEIPKTPDFDISSDMPVYINIIAGMFGGSGQSNGNGQPILGMDGRYSFTIKASSEGSGQITASATDAVVTMADGNQSVATDDNTWLLSIAGGTLKDVITVADLALTGLPEGLTATAEKQAGTNNIIITLSGKTSSEMTSSSTITAKVKATAFTDINAADTNEAALKIQISDCFIATAAFGSYLNPHVKVLRHLRDAVLLHSSPGRWFVSKYYQYSPAIAAVIRIHPTLKWVTRILLTPIIYGAAYPLTTLCLIIGLMFYYVLNRRRRRLIS
jgi:hypothetical protein